MKNKIHLFFLTILMAFGIIYPAQAAVPPEITAEAAVLMDMSSGQILYQKNMDKREYPASTTKILTTLIAIKRGNLSDMVRVSRESAMVGGSSVGLQEGEVMKMEDMLYAVMLASANEGAAAVGEHIGGSIEGFAEIMNSEAEAMGAVNSHFTTPHGLHDPDHYTTARDLAIIAREAMKNSVFRKYAGTYHYRVKRNLPKPVNGIPQEDFVNHNKLMWPGFQYEYKGITGIKPGFTDEARQVLVSSAERNGRELLSVVMKTENYNVYKDSVALLDYGFNQFKQVAPVSAGAEVGRVKVKRGVEEEIGALALDKFTYNVPLNDQGSIEKRVSIDGNVTAPVKKGQKVGVMRFIKDGGEIGSTALVADRDVDRQPFFRWWYGSVILVALFIFVRVQARARRRRYLFRKQKWY